MNLSDHFTFEEMTVTSNSALQEKNRDIAKAYIPQLTALCNGLEKIRVGLGAPLRVHSGFRCPELNGSLPGSSNKSQHMLGEACDFTCPSLYPEDEDGNKMLFRRVLLIISENKMPFGQIIDEGIDRGYGPVFWVHLSPGIFSRPIEKCGQVLTARDGVYKLQIAIHQSGE